jgi:hypothetical protein
MKTKILKSGEVKKVTDIQKKEKYTPYEMKRHNKKNG